MGIFVVYIRIPSYRNIRDIGDKLMCMEDVRIGRKSLAGESIKSVSQTSSILLPQSPKRTAIVISAPVTGYITLSFNGPVVSGSGIIINALGSPFCLDIQKHGAMVKKEIHAIHSATTTNVGVWETSLEEE